MIVRVMVTEIVKVIEDNNDDAHNSNTVLADGEGDGDSDSNSDSTIMEDNKNDVEHNSKTR